VTYLPWWLGGIALAMVPLLHWLLLGRMFAVSGRVTALVDRRRYREPELGDADLLAAIQDATRDAFGDGAIEKPHGPTPHVRRPQSPMAHVAFFMGLVLGGLLSALLGGGLQPGLGLRSELLPGGWLPLLVLVMGGTLVGFGTRMAAGCTSGHGLCGVSRLQPGSLLATASFFGAGILISNLLRWAL
jgi:uncharacterized protein